MEIKKMLQQIKSIKNIGKVSLVALAMVFMSACSAEINSTQNSITTETAATATVATLDSATDSPSVVFETSAGNFTVQLNAEAAPLSVANFLQYVENGFYNGTIFHRVISNFMIQGGGFTVDMTKKATRTPIINEADNGLKNKVGTIAMARTNAPHSATSQFFINVEDNGSLNHRAKNSRGWGYAVFGEVTEGLSVVEAIKTVPVGPRAGHQHMPLEAIIIQRIYLLD
jgi:peptidyl-prolyl cis-trans isomerase B (cyclophilin B)